MKQSSPLPSSIFHGSTSLTTGLPSSMPPRHRRGAFTLIELLVVISIIALLGSLLIMGLSHVTRSMKVSATKADLENAHGLFDEMNAASRLTVAPAQWVWRNLPASTYSFNPNSFSTPYSTTPYADPSQPIDFWTVPLWTPNPIAGATSGIPDCLEAPPGPLTTDFPILRNGSHAVLVTQLAMRVLLSYPTNKAAIAQLPADRWMIPMWVSGAIANTGVDGVLGTSDDASDTVKTVYYAMNNCVQDLDQSVTPPVMRTYRCTIACDASVAKEPYLDTSNANWVQDSNPTPVLLDARRNPIIFVPSSGLINVLSNVSRSPPHADSVAELPGSSPGPLTLTIPSISATPVTVDRVLPPIQSPDHRPFFVSAGPDGDLSTGDDNQYSFDK